MSEKEGELVTGQPKLLFDSHRVYAFDVARDGKRFLVAEDRDPGAQIRLDVVIQWMAEVRRRLEEAGKTSFADIPVRTSFSAPSQIHQLAAVALTFPVATVLVMLLLTATSVAISLAPETMRRPPPSSVPRTSARLIGR